MNNVLIPTDFTLSSIENAVHAARLMTGKSNIFFFHAFDMPESLIDVLHKSGINSHQNLITETLRIKCKKLKTEHANISNVYFRIMYGTTLNAFCNYTEANDIDAIFLPEGYSFKQVVRDSVNPDNWFKKSGIKIINKYTPKSPASAKREIVESHPNVYQHH